MEKTITGQVSYTITLKDGQCQIEFDRSTQNEMAVALIAHDMARFNREYLTKLKSSLKGKERSICGDKLSKMSQAIPGLLQMCHEIIQFYRHTEAKARETETTPEVKEGA